MLILNINLFHLQHLIQLFNYNFKKLITFNELLVYLVNLFWPSWPSILPNSKTHYLTTRGSQCFRFQHLSTTTQVAWVNKC